MDQRNSKSLLFNKLSKKSTNKPSKPYMQIGVFTADKLEFPVVIPTSDENKINPKKRIIKKCVPDMDMEYWEEESDNDESIDMKSDLNDDNGSKSESKSSMNPKDTFIAKKILFCTDFLRMINQNLTPKCSLFIKESQLLHGFDFLENLIPWSQAYNFKKQRIFNATVNKEGVIETPTGAKQLRGLGASAVFFSIVGIYDRSASNWGLIEQKNYFQVVNVDLDDVLWEENFNDITYKNPTDIIKEVFENLCDAQDETNTEFPLPMQFYDSDYLKMEIYETVIFLYENKTVLLNMLAHYIPDQQLQNYNQIISAVITGKIDSLYHQFSKDPQYAAVEYINSCFEELGYSFKLSQLDKTAREYLLSIYNFISPCAKEARDYFLKTVQEIFQPPQETNKVDQTNQNFSSNF